MKFRKVTAFLLTIALVGSFSLPAFAETSSADADIAAPRVVSYLEDENGNKCEIEGHAIDSPMLVADNEYVATYEFLLPLSVTTHSNTATGMDSSYSVRATTTINFQKQGNPAEYKLTSVSGNWTILDNSVSVRSASVRYMCRNTISGRNQYITRTNVNNNYYYATGFGTFIPAVDVCKVGSTLTLNLTHASSNYTWNLENYAVDSD